MKQICKYILLTILLLFSACSTSKKAADKHDNVAIENQNEGIRIDKNKVRDALVREAKKWKGVRYKSGGESHNGVDCSGLVMKVYLKVTGYKLPRNSSAQQKHVSSIKKKDLKPGDLVFFSINSKKVNHVGLYVGNGEMIHASGSRGVIISKLSDSYYVKHYHSSGRVKNVVK